jgi:multiple sugar transport system permease protein
MSLRRLAVYALLAGVTLLHTAPIVFMLVASLKPDSRVLADGAGPLAFVPVDASLQNYRDVLERVDFSRFLANSLLITGAIVALGLVVNSLAGYALARLSWRGRNTVLLAVLALLILPFEAIAVPLYFEMMFVGWRDNYAVQVVPFIANAFSIYLFYTFFLSLPRELEEAARIDGAGPWTTFFRIIVPISKPAFASVAILTFLTWWGSYLWPLMVTSGPAVRPLPLAVAVFQNETRQWGDIMAFGVMMVAPVLVIFLVFQRWFVRGVAATGLKG